MLNNEFSDGIEPVLDNNSESYKLEVVSNKDTVLLFCLSKLYKLDYPTLLFLYEKYDKDIFYIFYLFSGKKVSFPTSSKFQSIVYSSESIYKFLKSNEDSESIQLTSEEEDLTSELTNHLDLFNEKIVVPIDIIYNMV